MKVIYLAHENEHLVIHYRTLNDNARPKQPTGSWKTTIGTDDIDTALKYQRDIEKGALPLSPEKENRMREKCTAENVRTLRLLTGYTQIEFAYVLGVETRTVRNLEGGIHPRPATIEKYLRLASYTLNSLDNQ